MNDSAWCTARLDALEEHLHQLQYSDNRFRTQLMELREGLGGAVAADLFTRYLDPYQQETTQVREQQQAQIAALREVVMRMDEAEEPSAQIQELSDASARRLGDAASEVDTAHQRADRSLEVSTTAREHSNTALLILQSI